MSEIEKITQKIVIAKALAFIEELKNTDELNNKAIQTLILNEYKNTLEALSKNIEEIELLEEKLKYKEKQLNILLDLVDQLKKTKN